MLKYITSHLSTMEGIGIFPVVSFLIFFLFFLLLALYVAFMRKSHVKAMSDLPFQDGVTGDQRDPFYN